MTEKEAIMKHAIGAVITRIEFRDAYDDGEPIPEDEPCLADIHLGNGCVISFDPNGADAGIWLPI